MLAILTTHPIQYQVPLWQALATDGRVPFEVWYLTDHATRISHDREFGRDFAWDVGTLAGYPHRFVEVADGATPGSFLKCRLRERLRYRLLTSKASALWIQGWQVSAYWQAVWEANSVGAEVWLRGESNDLRSTSALKGVMKRLLLAQLFRRIDRFLYIGAANRRLYRAYGVPDDSLYAAPYAVDNQRFAQQAAALSDSRAPIRRQWRIADDAFCVLFCGKFIPKKRPLDLIAAARLLVRSGRLPRIHLLFVGSGEMADQLHASCEVAFEAESAVVTDRQGSPDRPKASFAGFMNQTEISKAYVAADCLVLPSDHGETWGLVVNEAVASGLPCVVSDACGCAEDVVEQTSQVVSFRCGEHESLAGALLAIRARPRKTTDPQAFSRHHSIAATVETVHSCYRDCERIR